jgi:WS/DGAT C-terminal domain/Wax ester synthase-like Acyl-CoA acyltransferase domain
MDRPTNLMVVTCVSRLDEPLDRDRVTAASTGRLAPASPRFAQRVVEPPLTPRLVGSRWADVRGFDVRDHLRRAVLPAPGDAGRATAVVTNIAGPPEPVATAWVPSTGPIGVGLSICSHAGELLVGVPVDEALVPDGDDLLSALADEVAIFRELR